ncbi:hypothetical protein BH10PAT1_BH10PAT1_4250 [soil metagenome]
MIDLIKFLIQKITGSEEFEVKESQDEKGTLFTVHAKPEIIGLIIGKGGKTIKNIRRVASIRGVLENKSISINVTETD